MGDAYVDAQSERASLGLTDGYRACSPVEPRCDTSRASVCYTCKLQVHTALANLAACLREAAGLTRAHNVGHLRSWQPGCGRPAPGWTVK